MLKYFILKITLLSKKIPPHEALSDTALNEIQIPNKLQKVFINRSISLDDLTSKSEYVTQLEEKILNLEQELNKKDEINQIEHIKENLDYTDLIWPLATTYRIATMSSEKTAKAINMFNLFEMIAAFNSIVLLSALPTAIYI